MPAKVREIKDDAIIEIKLNKNFYTMLKGVMLYILKLEPDEAKIKELVAKIINRDTDDQPHTEQEAAFKTMFLLLAEIENQAVVNDQFNTTEFPLPGEEGYVEPTQD
jgi:hypothetical protein